MLNHLFHRCGLLAFAALLGTAASAQTWQYFHGPVPVTALALEADTLWVGTYGGLEKRLTDGTLLARWHTVNSPLHSPFITCLAVDAAGNKWIGTRIGLYRLNAAGQWTSYLTIDGTLPQQDLVGAVAAAPDGSVWVGLGNRLARLDQAGNWSSYDAQNSALPDATVQAIGVDEDSIWVSTSAGGITRFGSDTPEHFTVLDGQYLDIVYDFAFSDHPEGRKMWLFTLNGVLRSPLGGEPWTRFFPSLHFYRGGSYPQPGEDEVWILGPFGLQRTTNHGLDWQAEPGPWPEVGTSNLPAAVYRAPNRFYFSGRNTLGYYDTTVDTVASFSTAITPELGKSGVTFLCAEQSGSSSTMWFGNADGSLTRCRNGNWTVFTDLVESTPGYYNGITGIVYNYYNEHVLALTSAGIHADFDSTQWTILNAQADAGNYSQLALVEIDANQYDIWIGRDNRIIRNPGPNQVEYNPLNSNYPGGLVRDLAVNYWDELWAATENGLARFDGSDWEVWNSSNAPVDAEPFTEVEAAGIKVVATQKAYRFYNGTNDWALLDLGALGLTDYQVTDLCLSSPFVWIATLENGLVRFKTDDMVADRHYTPWNSPMGGWQSSFIAADGYYGGLWIVMYDHPGVFYIPDAFPTGTNSPWTNNPLVVRCGPNPAADRLNLELTPEVADATITLANAAGQLVYTASGQQGNIVLDLSGLPAGMYVLQVSAAQGRQTIRVVKP